MSSSDITESLGIAFLVLLFFYSAWKNDRLSIKFERPPDSTFGLFISTILGIACAYFAKEIFMPDSSNIYKIIGEPFRIHPLLLRTKLHKFEDQLQNTLGLTAEQTFERIMGKDGMQLSYATLGNLVFLHPHTESLTQLRIPMVSFLGRSYGIMIILVALGQTMPNRGLWKKWGLIALATIGIIQLFCLTNLQFLNLDGNDTLLETTNRYKAAGFIAVLSGMLFIGETRTPTQNEVLLQTVRNLHQLAWLKSNILYTDSHTRALPTKRSSPSEELLPEFDKHEVLVKIKAVALNYRDIIIANGSYPSDAAESFVPCSDASGEVVQVGSEVKGFQVGDHVLSLFLQSTLYGSLKDHNSSLGGSLDGVLQQYRVFPEHGLVKLPKESKMTDSEAASLVCAGTTVWNALYGNVPLKPGQVVLLQGTGGVSIIGLQIARAAGAVTIITSSSDEKLQYVKEKYGADYTINYNTHPDWQKKVLEYTGGVGVDYVLENGGVGTIEKSIESVAYGGTVVLIGVLSTIEAEKSPNVALLALLKAALVRGVYVGSRQLQEELVRFAVAKDLHIAVDKEFDFTDQGINDAFEYLISQKHIGKVCIKLD